MLTKEVSPAEPRKAINTELPGHVALVLNISLLGPRPV